MCSDFLRMMENYQGDLADIVRATSTVADGGGTAAEQAAAAADWQFRRNSINYSSEYFGDPFTYVRDPLITQNIDTSPVPELFYNSNIIHGGDGNNSGIICGGGGVNLGHKVVDDEMKKPSNIFSRMLQISPNEKLPLSPCDTQAAAPPQRGLKNPSLLVSNNGTLLSPSSSGLQISSPRNTGIKRRKSQAKKVVCIPAPAPANSKSTGEVVPSDLWAWRKYGQKPIKGSPYPRGYYRCSSSKGCSARKQVERSRTDPNMLVITYTSEHNHPWPTQRNALAGSTRSQASKNSNNNGAKDTSPNSQTQKPSKETSSPVEENFGAVKKEADQELDHHHHRHHNHHLQAEFDVGILQTYKPSLADSSNNQEQDSFFADLGEIGDDPLNLFGQGFPRDSHNDLDPFSFYDWATTATATTVAKAGSAEESGRKS